MSDQSRASSPTGDGAAMQTTFAVEFVFEVESRAVAERLRRLLPGPEARSVEAEGYRSYVDTAGLDRPAVGASVPCRNRLAAELLYRAISDDGGVTKAVRSGTLALRQFESGFEQNRTPDDGPTVVAMTRYPR